MIRLSLDLSVRYLYIHISIRFSLVYLEPGVPGVAARLDVDLQIPTAGQRRRTLNPPAWTKYLARGKPEHKLTFKSMK